MDGQRGPWMDEGGHGWTKGPMNGQRGPWMDKIGGDKNGCTYVNLKNVGTLFFKSTCISICMKVSFIMFGNHPFLLYEYEFCDRRLLLLLLLLMMMMMMMMMIAHN